MFHLYGLFIGLAIVVGWTIAERSEPRVNQVAPWVILAGLLGARTYHVLEMWSYYGENLSQIVKVWNGGLSIWGGLIAGTIVSLIYFKGETYKFLSAVVTGLPLAQAIGRLGNGVNGEFINKVWILPWWAAEAILDLILFGIIYKISAKWRVGVYLLGYGLIRYLLQPYR